MTTKEKIRKYLDYKHISVNKFCIETGLSSGFLKSGKSISVDNARIIINKYPDLNPDWLVLDQGPMLRPVEAMEEAPQTLEEPRSGYSKAREVNPAICSACEERERIIASKDKQTEVLERQIEGLKAGFENQIEDLKSNLERLISEKSEVVKMKDEMLSMKEDIIRIQSKRIAELESHRELDEAKKIYIEQTMSENVMSSERGLLSDVVRIEEKKNPRAERPNL